jgi:hypothetical protein
MVRAVARAASKLTVACMHACEYGHMHTRWTDTEGGGGDFIATAIGVNDVSRHNLRFGSTGPE